MITTNSPRTAFRFSRSAASDRGAPTRNSSCIFVSSRATPTFVMPAAASSSSSFKMRCGDSYRTTGTRLAAMNFSEVCLPFLCGKNPKNKNSSDDSPAIDIAAASAEAPGIASIFASGANSRTRATSRAPGSEMPGVPASETNTIFSPASNRSITSLAFLSSVAASSRCNGFFISYRASNFDITRVSSA